MSDAASGATLPLSGRRIVVTRPRAQAGGLVAALEELGAHVVTLPTIRTEVVEDLGPLERECRALSTYDWLVFTSVNAVAPFAEAFERVGGVREDLERIATCAVGPTTAGALERYGIRVDAVPRRHVAEAVSEAMAAVTDLVGKRVLLPRSEQARDVVPRMLRSAGARVVDVVVYRTVPERGAAGELRREITSGAADLLVFTSGSAVHAFMEIVESGRSGVPIATIGPITSAVVREYGLEVSVEAERHTAEGLVSAIQERYA